MSNRIIDAAAVNGSIPSYGTVATNVVVTPPTRTGTFARIHVYMTGDFSMLNDIYLFQGNGTAGTMLVSTPPNEPTTTFLCLDDSPASQYTVAVIGSGEDDGGISATVFVDQVA